jgi:hypothetical protein
MLVAWRWETPISMRRRRVGERPSDEAGSQRRRRIGTTASYLSPAEREPGAWFGPDARDDWPVLGHDEVVVAAGDQAAVVPGTSFRVGAGLIRFMRHEAVARHVPRTNQSERRRSSALRAATL